MHYSSVRLPDRIDHDWQPVKSRWLRRTLHFTCDGCGRRRDPGSYSGGRCRESEIDTSADSIGDAVAEVVRRALRATHSEVFGPAVQETVEGLFITVDYDVSFMTNRVVVTHKTPEERAVGGAP